MKKKIFLGVLISVILVSMIFVLTGCEKKDNSTTGESNNSGSTVEKTVKKPDHKIYKYVKMSSGNASNLLYSASIFDDPSEVSNGDIYYKPCIVAEFDTETGKATKAKFYSFFLDSSTDEWVDKAIEKFESSSSKSKDSFTNVKKARVNEEVSYLSADLDINSYIFTQFIDTYIIKSQDIEKYKDEIYYSRLYNYSSTPPHEEGDNYFEESLESIRIEWSDKEIKAY